MVAAAPIAVFAIDAWRHTPPDDALQVVFQVPLSVKWTMPDGSVQADFEKDPPGTEAVWYRTGSRTDLRRWFPGQGYGTLEDVPEDFFIQGKIVRPQALSAVPPRSLT